MPSHPTNSVSDIVSLSALHLVAIIGPDHWHRTRPQPIQLSLYLHLAPLYLDTPGRSDDVADSLHYGHLTQAVTRCLHAKVEQGYASARALVDAVTDAAFAFVGDALKKDADAVGKVLHAVRIVISLSKYILLAGGFEIDLTTSASDWAARSVKSEQGSRAGAIVRVTDLVLPVLIGVNPPERLAKQRVITDLTFFEAAPGVAEEKEVDYPAIVQQIATGIERSAHLTLEKLVYEIIQTAYRASDACQSAVSETSTSRVEAVTVRCRKPSALSLADASGVEMTRTRDTLTNNIW